MATAKELRERVAELEDEVARLGRVVERTVRAVEHGEPVPLTALREALTGRWYNRWDAESLIDKAQEWAAEYGAAPKAAEWSPSHRGATPGMRERFYAGDWPTHSHTRRFWPKWNDFMAAAGFVGRTGPEAFGLGDGPLSDEWPTWSGWQDLAHYRARVGLTQQQLAAAAHCNATTISQMENGRHNRGAEPNPTIRLLLALAVPLRVRASTLVDG